MVRESRSALFGFVIILGLSCGESKQDGGEGSDGHSTVGGASGSTGGAKSVSTDVGGTTADSSGGSAGSGATGGATSSGADTSVGGITSDSSGGSAGSSSGGGAGGPPTDGGAGGTSGDNPCPATAPDDEDPCGQPGRCTYLDCGGPGRVSAICDGSAFSVESFPCDMTVTQCGDATCEPGMVCVEQLSGVAVRQCMDNPCGSGAIVCGCAAQLCPEDWTCSVMATTVTCESPCDDCQ